MTTSRDQQRIRDLEVANGRLRIELKEVEELAVAAVRHLRGELEKLQEAHEELGRRYQEARESQKELTREKLAAMERMDELLKTAMKDKAAWDGGAR